MTGSRRNRPRLLALLALTLVLLVGASACGGDDDDDDTAADDNSEQTTTAPDDGGDDSGDDETDSGGSDASAEVDTCALLTKADAEEVLGATVGAPEVQEPTGALLGGCQYIADNGSTVGVSARPASEYEATVGALDDTEEVDVGAEAVFSESIGLLMTLDGQDYLVQVIALKGSTSPDKATSIAAAEKVEANA